MRGECRNEQIQDESSQLSVCTTWENAWSCQIREHPAIHPHMRCAFVNLDDSPFKSNYRQRQFGPPRLDEFTLLFDTYICIRMWENLVSRES